ncbi:hypothetical protein L798_12823, partial [Zootermopsis nevadensis]
LGRKEDSTASENQLVFITGCDSGLGFSFALHAYKLGYTVVAGCLQANGAGSTELLQLCPQRLHVLQLDVTSDVSVQTAAETVQEMLAHNPHYELRALINNAGVMIFGEFEWLTEQHILKQIDVNLLGAMRTTKSFSSMLRKYKGRVIAISSHCALAALPGLAVYGATKAGLLAWCDGLRVEQAKYGVPVISFIPGSFFQHTSILAKQQEYAKEMEEAMTPVDCKFFGDYFRRYNEYLSGMPTPRKPLPLQEEKLYSMLEHALLSKYPCPHYECATPRYRYYHFLFKTSPTWLRDYLVQRFMQMPEF